MEERNLELDDDGKIKLKKAGFAAEEEETGEDLVIEVPDFDKFAQDDGRVGLSDEALAAKAEAREALAARKRAQAEALLREGDELFAAGDLTGAGEKYLDSGAAYAADWRPWLGVVRVQTRDFTDFSEIYDCERAYERALRLMPKEERAALAQKYAPLLEGQAAAAEEEAAELTQKDISAREEARPALEREHKSALICMIVFLALFAASAVAGGVLACFISAVRGAGVLIAAIVLAAAAFVLLFMSAWAVKCFISARLSLIRNRRGGTSEFGKRAAQRLEESEIIRSVIEDLQK